MLFGPSGKGRKRQKKGEKGRFRPISRTGGQTPLKPPFVTLPFAALQFSFSPIYVNPLGGRLGMGTGGANILFAFSHNRGVWVKARAALEGEFF